MAHIFTSSPELADLYHLQSHLARAAHTLIKAAKDIPELERIEHACRALNLELNDEASPWRGIAQDLEAKRSLFEAASDDVRDTEEWQAANKALQDYLTYNLTVYEEEMACRKKLNQEYAAVEAELKERLRPKLDEMERLGRICTELGVVGVRTIRTNPQTLEVLHTYCEDFADVMSDMQFGDASLMKSSHRLGEYTFEAVMGD